MVMAGVLESLTTNLNFLTSQGGLEPGKLEEKLPELGEISSGVVDILQDGWQLSDIISLGKLFRPIMELAATIEEYSGPEKEQFVVDAAWLIYRAVDKGPDGRLNRINIPIVFGHIEEAIEKRIVSFVAKFAVRALFDTLRERGLV